MLTQEFRIVLPFEPLEYQVGQLYMVAKYSKAESSSGDDGVEIVVNEPFSNEQGTGQYTHKRYYLAKKLPAWLVKLLPAAALVVDEKAWNSFPDCLTVYTSPYLTNFKLELRSKHFSDAGQQENVFGVPPELLSKRAVDYLDIAADPWEKYEESEDPAKFHSTKTGRGPLTKGWQKRTKPIMCAYKLVNIEVPYFGILGSRIEKYAVRNAQRKVLLQGHRKCFCWMDEWFGMTLEDIRTLEKKNMEELNSVVGNNPVPKKDPVLAKLTSRHITRSNSRSASRSASFDVPQRQNSIDLPKSSDSRESMAVEPTRNRRASFGGILTKTDVDQRGDNNNSTNLTSPITEDKPVDETFWDAMLNAGADIPPTPTGSYASAQSDIAVDDFLNQDQDPLDGAISISESAAAPAPAPPLPPPQLSIAPKVVPATALHKGKRRRGLFACFAEPAVKA
eukprot:jgi/Chlat1/5326/Chrsp35S08984